MSFRRLISRLTKSCFHLMDSLWLVAVLLGDCAINWIDVPEYEVHFHIIAALVRSEHDGIGCLVIELRINRFGFGGCLWFMAFWGSGS